MSLPSATQLAARHARVRSMLAALGLDALVVTSPPNVRYLSSHAGSSGSLVLTLDAVHLLVDFRYRESVKMLQSSTAACPALRVWDVPGSYDEALLACLTGIGATTVGFEAAHVAVARYDWWHTTIEARGMEIVLRSTQRVVEQARVIKDSFEVAAIREAARRLERVAQAAFAAARPGVRERDVAASVESSMRAEGFERPAFDTIVASGPHSALPHHRAGERSLTAGDLVVLDFGGVLDGYCCDLTRTVSVGPPSPESRRLYAAVHDAQHAAVAAVRPGAMTADVDAAARGVIEERGLGKLFGHGTGHGLGLDVHEDPRITWARADVPTVAIAPGMVFTIEPGVYVPGYGGVRIEDDVLVTDRGCELLTTVSREFLTV